MSTNRLILLLQSLVPKHPSLTSIHATRRSTTTTAHSEHRSILQLLSHLALANQSNCPTQQVSPASSFQALSYSVLYGGFFGLELLFRCKLGLLFQGDPDVTITQIFRLW